MEYTLHLKKIDDADELYRLISHIPEQIRNYGKAVVACADPNTILGMVKQVFDIDLVYDKHGTTFHFHR